MTSEVGERFDAAVIGAGLAGCATAVCLARTGLQTLIVGPPAAATERIGESLPPSATGLLHRFELLQNFLETEPLPCYGNRSSWGGDGQLVDYDFIRDPVGHGWHIDRVRFEAMLLAAALSAGAAHAAHHRLAGVESADGGWRLRISNERSSLWIGVPVVIDASGRAAAVVRRLGGRSRRHDRLVASVAFLRPGNSVDRDSFALIEAVKDGWWYSAVLPSGALATALMTDADLLRGQCTEASAAWRARLDASVYTRARVREHGYQLERKLRVVPAWSSALERAAGEGWIAVGDAAAAHDPLSSHGIVHALSGGLQAAAAVQGWLGGSAAALSEYADREVRAYDNYLRLRDAYYADETRWPEAAFWRRRQQKPPGSADQLGGG